MMADLSLESDTTNFIDVPLLVMASELQSLMRLRARSRVLKRTAVA